MHIRIAKFAQLANFFAILAEAHNRESAFVIGRTRRTHIQKSRPIGQFDNVVNVRLDAHILVGQLCSFIRRDAWFWVCSEK